MSTSIRLFNNNVAGVFTSKKTCHGIDLPGVSHWRVGVGELAVDDIELSCPTLVKRDVSYLEVTLDTNGKLYELLKSNGPVPLPIRFNRARVTYDHEGVTLQELVTVHE